MKPLLLLPLLIGSMVSAAESTSPLRPWPLWDNQESVEQYAQRVGLPPTKTLDLGNGMKLELVLIPAGQFIMGTPEPVPVDEDGFRKQIVAGQALLALGGGVLLVLLGAIVFQTIRNRQRPKFSLSRLTAMTIAAGVSVLSGMHWQHSAQSLEREQTEYQAAKARFAIADSREKPAHVVRLTKPFYMSKFTVTQEQYQQVTGTNPSRIGGKNHPVEHVSWYEALEFCKRLTEKNGQEVRLPTEAEYEFSCRAGTITAYYTGDSEQDLARAGWYDANSNFNLHPVGQKEANAFGLFDMHGNVEQWCQDWYDEDYYQKSPLEDPVGPTQGTHRVFRSGPWLSYAELCRSAYRNKSNPDDRGLFSIRLLMPASK